MFNIRTRIIVFISVILVITVGVSSVIVLNSHRKRLLESRKTDIAVLGETILRGIEGAMARGATDEVQSIVENIGRGPEILSLRILAEDGTILKSRAPEEIGLRSQLTDRAGIAEKPSAVASDDSVIYTYPIQNKAACYGCHSEDIKTNGIIEIRYDLSRSAADIAAMRRTMIVSAVFVVLFVSAALALLMTRAVLVPLERFIGTIQAVAQGDWEARVSIPSDDEIGEVGRAFNKMLDEVKALHHKSVRKEKELSRVKVELDHKGILEELNAQLQYKVKEVESANKAVLTLSKEVKSKNIELEKMVDRLKRINEVGRLLSSIINPPELMRIIIKTTCETLRVERGTIHISRDRDNTLTMLYDHGAGAEETGRGALPPLFQELLLDGKNVLINRRQSDSQPALGASISAIGVPLRMKGQIIGGMLLERKLDGGHFGHDELELLDTMANQAIVAMENAWLYETVKTNYFGTIQSLVNALEASDRYTRGHSERVRFLALELARFIGLDYRELEVLEHAAILHDIGKIGIDTSVLNKEQQLTTSELSLIRAHPIIGDEILGPIGTLEGVRTAILQHHERYDGKGYPYGISGEEITLKARILAVIDTFDAMMTDRPYRRALPLNNILNELHKGSGSQFDPSVVSAFLELVKENTVILREAGYPNI